MPKYFIIYSNANRLLKLVEKLKDAAGTELMQKITSFGYDNNGNEQRRSVEYITLYSKANPKPMKQEYIMRTPRSPSMQ